MFISVLEFVCDLMFGMLVDSIFGALVDAAVGRTEWIAEPRSPLIGCPMNLNL